MLLGQGMQVHHMLVRTVMVMVMVKVDGELWHSHQVYVWCGKWCCIMGNPRG